MTTPNHVAGGIVITGVFSSFVGFNILESIPAIATVIVASIFPDIDHPSSLIGKTLLPISKFLNKRFGHRTLTHSLLGFLIFTCLFAISNNYLFPSHQLTTIAAIAYASHIILDMMTKAGVILFYPFLKNPCVMPGQPQMRFKTGDLRTETMIFSFFTLMGIFLYPLMSNGFWTQYNRTFGTPAHLVSEFQKSDNLLLVHWKIKQGTAELQSAGYCISAESPSKIYLIDQTTEQIHQLEGIVLSTIPEHTNKTLNFQPISFVNISTDSLNYLLTQNYFRELQFVANNDFEVNGKKVNSYKEEWIDQLLISEIIEEIEEKQFLPQVNPRIAVLRQQLQEQITLENKDVTEYNNTLKRITELRKNLKDTLSIVERQLKQEELNQLLKIQPPKPSKIQSLKTQIQSLLTADARKNHEQQRQIQQHNKALQKDATRFTGTGIKLIIDSS